MARFFSLRAFGASGSVACLSHLCVTCVRSAISDLMHKCLDAKGVDCAEWEREIDERVAGLYGF